MSIESDAADAAVHTAIHALQREQMRASLSSIRVLMARAEVSETTERQVDRALQRLRKRGIVKYHPKHGWLCVTYERQIHPAYAAKSVGGKQR